MDNNKRDGFPEMVLTGNSLPKDSEARNKMIEEMKKKRDLILKNLKAEKEKKKQMNDSVIDSVLGFVVADALGVPVEFKSREELNVRPLKEMIGYGSHFVPEGTWSDDSSMLLATMDSITERSGIDYNDMMKKFCDWYVHKKYTGTGVVFDIGISTHKALNKFYNGIDALDCGLKGEYDNGNGSLMRILPVSLYSYYNNLSEEEEIEMLNNCSSLTHAHEISKLGCKIYTDYISAILDGKDKREAFNALLEKNYSNNYSKNSINKYTRLLNVNFEKLNISQIKSSGYIVDTLEASIWCVLNTDSYEEAVIKAVNLGGDTDTIAAVTGSIAGLLYGRENIPQRWQSKLRNKEYLMQLIDNYGVYLSNSLKKNISK